ncbi:40S ribosomal protein S6, putative, partial [Leishmania donovani]
MLQRPWRDAFRGVCMLLSGFVVRLHFFFCYPLFGLSRGYHCVCHAHAVSSHTHARGSVTRPPLWASVSRVLSCRPVSWFRCTYCFAFACDALSCVCVCVCVCV